MHLPWKKGFIYLPVVVGMSPTNRRVACLVGNHFLLMCYGVTSFGLYGRFYPLIGIRQELLYDVSVYAVRSNPVYGLTGDTYAEYLPFDHNLTVGLAIGTG